MKKFEVTSPSFKNNEAIPSKFTCDGENINPRLEFHNLPEETKSIAVIMDDPDSPSGHFLHWMLWDIPPTDSIDEGNQPGKAGLNDFMQYAYGGPCPPMGAHHYVFRAYALDKMLGLQPSTTRSHLEEEMEGHVLASAELKGSYTKHR